MTGVAIKAKKGRVPLVAFSNEHNLRAVKLLFKGLYINGMKPLMDATAEIDETCAAKGGWCYDILRAAEIPATSTKKKAVITVEQLEGNAEGAKDEDHENGGSFEWKGCDSQAI